MAKSKKSESAGNDESKATAQATEGAAQAASAKAPRAKSRSKAAASSAAEESNSGTASTPAEAQPKAAAPHKRASKKSPEAETMTAAFPAAPAAAHQPAAPVAKPSAPAAAKPPVAAPKPSSPLINTDFAAQAAARMLLARSGNEAGKAPPKEGQKESAAFKQLKESLASPHKPGVEKLLNTTAPTSARRSDQPFGQKQVGHNQTFGADVSRRNLPRRTGG